MGDEKVMKSKRVLSLLLLSATIFGTTSGFFSTPASAKTITTTDKTVNSNAVITPRSQGSVVVTAKSGANIRSGPGTGYSIIGTLAYGDDTPYAYQSSNGWYKIEWGSSYGWISSSTCVLQ